MTDMSSKIIHNFRPDFLPVEILISGGCSRDYRTLARFHYLPKKPATWCRVVVARYQDETDIAGRLIGVGVLSFPSALNRSRHQVFGIQSKQFGQRLQWVNQNIRTISRVIVHPQFRAIGLASVLIRSLIDICPTQYIESCARMGRAHPMFERAGMHRFDPATDLEPLYYWMDRNELSQSL